MRRYDTGHRPSRRVLTAVVGIVVVLIGVAIWLHGKPDPTGAGNGAAPGQSASNTAEISREVPADPPSDGVALPEGTDQIAGYATGFPASDLGAVSAQVAIARAQVGFDYNQAAQVAGIYAAPDTRAVLEERSRAAVALRRDQAGVSADGKVPAPASYAVTPVAFTLEELDSGNYAVSLLSYVSLTDAEGTIGDFLYCGTQVFGWIEGDWKVIQPSQADLEHLVATGPPPAVAPETPEYERAGWITIRGEYQ